MKLYYQPKVYKTKKGYLYLRKYYMFSDLLPFKVAVSIEEKLMSIKNFIPSILFDFIEGIISGIPLCCVISYSLNQKDKYKWNSKRKTHDIPYWIEYVPCSVCISKRKFVRGKTNVPNK